MRVGTRKINQRLADVAGDHPHACGDKTVISVANASRPGSSPCVWGQEKYLNCANFLSGIIPMRVGTSC